MLLPPRPWGFNGLNSSEFSSWDILGSWAGLMMRRIWFWMHLTVSCPDPGGNLALLAGSFLCWMLRRENDASCSAFGCALCVCVVFVWEHVFWWFMCACVCVRACGYMKDWRACVFVMRPLAGGLSCMFLRAFRCRKSGIFFLLLEGNDAHGFWKYHDPRCCFYDGRHLCRMLS